MDNTIIILLKTLLFFGTAYVYIILISCLGKYAQYRQNPDSVSLFVTDRQKKHLLIAFLVMVFSILFGLIAAELIRGSDVFGALFLARLLAVAFCTVNPFALFFYGFFLFLSHQQKKLLAGQLPPPSCASELRFERYGKGCKSWPFVCFFLCVLFAALSLFFTVREDDYHYLLLGLLPIAYFGLFALLLIFRSGGGHVLDMIRINAEGIRLESWKGRDVFIPWDYIYEMKKYISQSGGSRRGPLVISVKSISGEEITWFATDLEPELFILDLHPELKLIFERK